ncbi:hypothetical protein LF599_02570 [Pseudodesulfovibrio thermohalotolerans]|uniref:hypothetical protein n=1 Tax=Pseudodesulfovibrio thermohalotolerans TaxID=2880651 RepID=UPI0024412D96|nr:hypothetical protein [Pseudodesulfovibrio thermohalotolerans]WFS63061.1 hypothetical protein LF599_02570 [Pseudodesulfovibrio thermohalotolerans]
MTTTALAVRQLETWEAEFADIDKVKAGALLHKMGVPFQITEVMLDLWDNAREIGGKLVGIGKIICCKIIEFVQRNPNLALGVALGVSASLLTSMVPWIGPILAPLVAIIAIPYAGIAGMMIDLRDRGESTDSTIQATVLAAKEFYRLVVEIFQAIKETL